MKTRSRYNFEYIFIREKDTYIGGKFRRKEAAFNLLIINSTEKFEKKTRVDLWKQVNKI